MTTTDQTTEDTTAEKTEDVATTDTPAEGVRQTQAPEDEGADTISTPDGTEGERNTVPVTEDEDEQDTFPRAYVEKLRQENGKFRQRAQRADELAHRLHTSLVAATGRLADPTDLEYADDHLDDPEALTAAVEALVAAKPHLAARRPRGDVGQGATAGGGTVDLAAMLRARA